MTNKLTNDQKNHLFLDHLQNSNPSYHESVLSAIEEYLETSDRNDVYFVIYGDGAKPVHEYVKKNTNLHNILWFDYMAYSVKLGRAS